MELYVPVRIRKEKRTGSSQSLEIDTFINVCPIRFLLKMVWSREMLYDSTN